MKKTIPFTTTSIKAASYSLTNTPYTIPDPKLAGFKVRIGKKKKVFIVESRIKGCKGSAITVTCGTFSSSAKAGAGSLEIVSIEKARQQARTILDMCERGIDPRTAKADSGPTFREALNAYKDSKPAMLASTAGKLALVAESIGDLVDKPLLKITAKECIAVYSAKRMGDVAKGGQKKTRGGPAAAKNLLQWMVTIFNFAEDIYQDYDIRNTAEKALKRCNEEWEAKRPFLNKEQIGPWLVLIEQSRKQAPCDRERVALDALRLCLFTGLRISEAINLKWSDMLFESASIAKTKNKHSHSVRLSTQAKEILDDARAYSGTEFVFDLNGSPITYKQVWRVVQNLDLPYDFGAHATRRTMASACEYLEIPFLTYKRMLNHAFKGGVTGGYVNSDFDPAVFERFFQRLGDFFEDLKLQSLHPEMSVNQVAVTRMMKQYEALTDEQQALFFEAIQAKHEPKISLVA